MQYYRYYINILVLLTFIISSPSVNNQLISNEKYIAGDDGVIRMYINVLGHVESPGLYLVYDGIDILSDLSIAGGYKNGANLNNITIYKEDGTQITLVQSDIDAARVTLDAEAAAVKYQTDRTTDGKVTYDSWRNQLAMLYDDMLAGKLDTTGTWATHIKAVKDANPKPS